MAKKRLKLKKIVSISLALVILSAPVGKAWVFFCFQLNKAYIVEHICQERKILENTCQGQCYLKTQLAQAEKEAKKDLQNLKYEVDILFSMPLLDFEAEHMVLAYLPTLVACYLAYLPEQAVKDIPHPPCAYIL